MSTKICLTVAGLDPSGGAGVLADVRTFSAFGCFATAAVSAITFQNTVGVQGSVGQSAETLMGQLTPIFADLHIDAVKTGMLPTREAITVTAAILRENSVAHLVVDPVVRSTSGFDLIDDAALDALIEELLPLASVVTPNLAEAERIAKVTIDSEDSLAKAADLILARNARSVLIKGGHGFAGREPTVAVDHLFDREGRHETFESGYIRTTATHGTGCVLSAAICANLALGHDLDESIAAAKAFVTEAIRTSPNIGRGHSPINIPQTWPTG